MKTLVRYIAVSIVVAVLLSGAAIAYTLYDSCLMTERSCLIVFNDLKSDNIHVSSQAKRFLDSVVGDDWRFNIITNPVRPSNARFNGH